MTSAHLLTQVWPTTIWSCATLLIALPKGAAKGGCSQPPFPLLGSWEGRGTPQKSLRRSAPMTPSQFSGEVSLE